MLDIRIASRYAKSLIDLATEKGVLEAVYTDMVLVEDACKHSRELVNVLNSPIIKTDKKEAIVKEIFSSRVSALTAHFLDTITRKGREGYIYEVATSFVMQYRTLTGVTTAKVRSAIALDESARLKIRALLKESGYPNVELVEEVDTDLIGGFVLRIGDKQVDTTVKSEIVKLKQGFKHNLYEEQF